mgnify:CR=1 FL=1
MTESPSAEPCLQALRDLSLHPEASEDEIDAVLHNHLCTELDDAARLAVVEYITDEAHYEVIGRIGQRAFWERVLVVALDKHRLMTRDPSIAYPASPV